MICLTTTFLIKKFAKWKKIKYVKQLIISNVGGVEETENLKNHWCMYKVC